MAATQRAVRIGIIGAGPTGALVAAGIAAAMPGALVTVLDKARAPGGRMSTTRLRDGSAQADHGAQYITALTSLSEPVIAELVSAGVLAPLPPAALRGARASARPHYAAPEGTAAIAAHFLAQSRAALVLDARVTALARAGGGGAAWRVSTDAGSDEREYDAVVSTLPAPQVLQLGGDVPALLAATRIDAALRQVAYSVRFAAVAYYPDAAARELEEALPFAGRFLRPDEDDALCYVSHDSHKRALAGARAGGGSPSVVVHSSTAFGAAHAGDDKAAVGAALLGRLRALYPSLPQPASTRAHRWLYSQVTAGYPAGGAGAEAAPPPPGPYGLGAVLASAAPPLVLAGDSFSGSHLEGCVASAQAAVAALRRALPG